jgi:FdhE protein
VSAVQAPDLPAETRDALRRLTAADEARLETLADAVLAGDVREGDVACAPFVGAALQAWFGALASRLDPASVPRGAGDRCPVCASPPVAAVVGGGDRLRYLSCALCGADWNVPRVQCTLCAKDADLSYFHLEGESGTRGDTGAKAEACAACRAYVKVFDEQKRPGAEAAADDAATLALDLLLAEDGWRRAGVNLYLASAAEPPA